MNHLVARRVAIIILLSLFGWTAIGVPLRADTRATIQFVPPVGIVRSGETFPVIVRVTSGSEQINAVEATIRFPAEQLEVSRLSQEQSVLTLWPERPAVDAAAGTIRFAGGRPGGFIAQDATVLTVYFTARAGGLPTLLFDTMTTALYLHDGAGTKLDVTPLPTTLTLTDSLVDVLPLTSATHPAADFWSPRRAIVVTWPLRTGADYSFLLSTDPQAAADDAPDATTGTAEYTNLADGIYSFTIKERPLGGDWSAVIQRRFLIDGTPPLPFTLAQPDPASVGGVALLTWSAEDATSGVTKATLTVNGALMGEVTSPLTLQSGWRTATLTVTVYDAAGNATTAAWQPPTPPSTDASNGWWYVVGAAALLAGAAVFALRRR